MVIPRFGLVGRFLRVIMQPKSIFRIAPQPNPNFRLLAVRNLVGLALCLAVADRAAGSPQDPLKPNSSDETNEKCESRNHEPPQGLREGTQFARSKGCHGAVWKRSNLYSPKCGSLHCREAVQARYQHGSQTIKVNVVFTIHEIVEMGDLAYGRTTSVGQQEVLATHKISREANNELFIFRREQGQWKIHRYMFANSNPPAAN